MDTRCLTNSFTVADLTIVVLIFLWSLILWHLFDALRIQARHAFFLTFSSTTWMTAGQKFITRSLHEIEACTLSTDIFECRFHTWGWLSKFFLTESADGSILFVASLSLMIWLSVTLDAEILMALSASDPIVCHMLCSCMRNWLTFFIFLTLDDISRNHFHNISAGATYEARVKFYNLHVLIFLNRLFLFFSQKLFCLVVMNLISAFRTINLLIHRQFRYSDLP